MLFVKVDFNTDIRIILAAVIKQHFLGIKQSSNIKYERDKN